MKPTLEMTSADHPALQGLFEPGWDHSRDILVVIGTAEADLFEALAAVGQQRVVNILSIDEVDPPEPFKRAANALDMYQAILEFTGEAPARAAVRRQPNVELSQSDLDQLIDSLRGAISTYGIFRETVTMHAPNWAKQGIGNLRKIANLPSVDALNGAFSGVPCVIVSPGPSLDLNAHLLSKFNGRALIMTCSHALGSMEAAGVAPNIIAVSDPKYTGRHFKDCESIESATLCLDAVVEPRNFEIPSKRKFTFATHESVQPWIYGSLGESAYVESGGSVACVELSLARQFGCDPIIMVGQDLALTGGRYYAKTSIDGMAYIEPSKDGSAFELVRPHINDADDNMTVTRHDEEGLKTVPAWGGGEVQTSSSLFTFLQWFRTAARSMEGRVYNCTEGGAYIEGMEHISLSEFLETHPLVDVDIDAILDECANKVDLPTRHEALRVAVTEMLAGIRKCEVLAKTCIQQANQALRSEKALKELGRLEKQLAAAIGPIKPLSMLAQQPIREAQAQAEAATTLDDNLDAAKQLFKVVIESARALDEPLAATLAELTDG